MGNLEALATASAPEIMQAFAAVRILWTKMCRSDGIDPKSRFVEFSKDNPYQAEYNEAMVKYQKLAEGAR
jgi:hypothetical protein